LDHKVLLKFKDILDFQSQEVITHKPLIISIPLGGHTHIHLIKFDVHV